MTDTKELRRLALLATPGPWEIMWREGWTSANVVRHGERGSVGAIAKVPSFARQDRNEANDVRYIAAASPSVVLALLDIRDAAANLIAQKGRHNTEIAYKRLAALLVAPQPEKEEGKE